MSSILQSSSTSTPNFQPVFENALEDLTAHPLAAQVTGCDSPEAILDGKANEPIPKAPKSVEKDKTKPQSTVPEKPANATKTLPPAAEETPAEVATKPAPPTYEAAASRPPEKIGRRLSSRIGEFFKPRAVEASTPAKVDENPSKIDEPGPTVPLESSAAPTPVRQTAKFGRRLSSRIGEFFRPKEVEASTPAKVDENPPKIDDPVPVVP